MRQRVRFCLALAVVVAAFAAQTATAATLVTTVQSAVGSGGGTYIDLTPAGITNGGITGAWVNFENADNNMATLGDNSWGFADTSNSDITVNGDSADDKTTAPVGEIEVDYTGLLANRFYNLYAIVVADIRIESGTSNAGSNNDIEWGTTSGSLTLIEDSVHQTLAETNPITIGSGGANANGRLIAVPLGQVAASNVGAMALYFGPGAHAGSGNSVRTQLDGVLFDLVPETVPEPSTLVLLGVAAIAGAYVNRRP